MHVFVRGNYGAFYLSACQRLRGFSRLYKPTRWFAPSILPMARPSSRCTSSSRASLLLLCTCLWRRIRAELALSALGLRWRDISLTSPNHHNQIPKHQNAPESNPMHQNQIQKINRGSRGPPWGPRAGAWVRRKGKPGGRKLAGSAAEGKLSHEDSRRKQRRDCRKIAGSATEAQNYYKTQCN